MNDIVQLINNKGKMFEEYFNSLSEKDVAEETAVDKIKKIIKGKITNPNINWKKATLNTRPSRS